MERLETQRLILRPWTPEDAADLYEYARDPRVGLVAGWPVHKDLHESLEIIRTLFSAPGVFAMELKNAQDAQDMQGRSKVVGSVGFTDRHRTELPCPDDEVGYCLNPAYWGQGLMPEAVGALLRHGFAQLGLETIWCDHYEGNMRSRRVIEKCGFYYQFAQESEVHLLGETRMTHYYALKKEDWRL